MIGIDVSYANDVVDWQAVKNAGMEFAIVRTGAGQSIVEEDFQRNVEGAHAVGLKVGAYHYSYALTPSDATKEAILCKQIINDAGVLLELPVFFDMEDDDKYKQRHSFNFTKHNITNICKAFLEYIKPLNCGIYASLSWFENYIDWKALYEEYHCPIWSAQWSNNDYLQGYCWQFTNKYMIDGKPFDANIIYDNKHQAGLNPFNV